MATHRAVAWSVLVATVAACEPIELTPAGATVHLADENLVRGCRYVTDVHGEATGATGEIDGARSDARNTAARLGATHLVFVQEQVERHHYYVMARVYVCPVSTLVETRWPGLPPGPLLD